MNNHAWTKKWLYIFAELEACGIKPGDKAFFREIQLKALKCNHGKKYYIGRGFWIHNGKNLTFGNRCSLGEFCRILDHGPINIGDDFITATGLQINSGTHDLRTMEPSSVEINIGNRVWCGANVTIVAGATIGDDVVLGAGSLVKSNIPANVFAAGVPAKVIKPINRRPEQPIWSWCND